MRQPSVVLYEIWEVSPKKRMFAMDEYRSSSKACRLAKRYTANEVSCGSGYTYHVYKVIRERVDR